MTHSTLPMWKKNRNVKITYTQLPPNAAGQICLDDKVEYQPLKSEKLKTVEGIDTPAVGGAWNWRGKGWLKIASSHWQVLGYGGQELERAQSSTSDAADGSEEWIVTYFAKTLFTPAGIDIYSRKKDGLKAETLLDIKKALTNVNAADIKTMAGELFEVNID